ncbi:hypothetical protein CUN67_07720 [Pantoea cypripedii]|uniref:Uncharacterized protein n=1 Tax=Pantoea cypripedii TaxID=55209 RepID=A0A6B9FXQ5_PANCY|nr:hypothetical protein CUN67_07720 [Pantoea cypripedii]
MNGFVSGTPRRRFLVNLIWLFTILPLSNQAAPCSPMNTHGWLGVLSWVFMLIGAYAFYSGLFRFYVWFNSK